MAYKLQLKRGLTSALPTGSAGEPLFTTDTNDLYIGTGSANQRYQKYIASGTSSQFLKGDGSLDSNTYYLASNPSAYIALTALSASSPLSYNNTNGAFTIAQASGSANGYLSSTDWTTFNNKQNALTNPVTGTGTTNQIPKFSGSSTIANSNILDNGTDVIINSRTSVTDANGNFVTITPNDGTNTRIEGNANKPLLIATSGASLKLAAGGVTPQVTLTSTGLGIGTTSPAYKLDVQSAAGVAIRVRNTFNTDDAYLLAQNTLGSALFGINAVGQYLYTGDAIPTLFYNNGAERMRITSAGLVGIGTTSPSVKLDVVGAGYFSSSVTSTDLRFLDAAYITADSDNSGSNPIVFRNGGTGELARITSTGNLGLGVTPSAWNAGSYRVLELPKGSSIHAQTDAPVIEVASNMYINNSYAYTYTVDGYSTRYRQNNGIHSWYNAPSGTAGNAISFTQAMTLDASGNLGLGVTAPEGKIHINGSTIIGGASTIGLQLENALSTVPSSNVRSIIANTSSSIVVAGALLLQPRTGVTAPILFYTEGSERLRITSGGRLGLGTTNPYNLLEVRSGTAGTDVARFSDSNYADLVIGFPTSGYASIDFEYGTGGGLMFRSGTGKTTRMTIKTNTINFASLPTSATGLSAGDIWNDGGTLKIV